MHMGHVLNKLGMVAEVGWAHGARPLWVGLGTKELGVRRRAALPRLDRTK
jgi:hypothetical protein